MTPRDIHIDAPVEKLRAALGVSEDELPDNPTQAQLKAAFAGGPRTRAPQHTSRPPDADLHNTMDANERERILSSAVEAGKFQQSRVEHYRTLLEQDPHGTATLIEQMQSVRAEEDVHSLDAANELAAAVGISETNVAYPDHWLPEVHAGRNVVTYGND